MIDIQIQLPTGEVRRVREVAPVQGRRAAERYEQQVRARLMLGEDLGREQEVIDDDDDDAVRVTVGKRWRRNVARRIDRGSGARDTKDGSGNEEGQKRDVDAHGRISPLARLHQSASF